MHPSRTLRRLLWLILLPFACTPPSPPPKVASKPITAPVAATVTALPWEGHVSVASGTEASAAAAPPVLIRNAILMLATGKTIPRGSILLERGKIAAIAEGELSA